MRTRCFLKTMVGVGILAFGAGVLISFFIPEAILVVIESVALIALGVL